VVDHSACVRVETNDGVFRKRRLFASAPLEVGAQAALATLWNWPSLVSIEVVPESFLLVKSKLAPKGK